MDFSTWVSEDIEDRLQLDVNEAYKSLLRNQSDDTVSLGAFIGGREGRLGTYIENAINKAVDHCLSVNKVKLSVDKISNDDITKDKLTPTMVIDRVMGADVGLMAAHFSEGNIGKSSFWNISNCLSNLDRLKFSRSNLMGRKNGCSVYRQDKIIIYEIMNDYCLPSIAISLPETYEVGDTVVCEDDIKRLER